MKKLMIRVETIDGDVDYIDLEQMSQFCFLVRRAKCLTLNVFEIHDRFYPEYRLCDLKITFVFVDSDYDVGDTGCDDSCYDNTLCDDPPDVNEV